MGFFSDLFEGNFGNLWHDITADPVAEIGLGTAAVLGTGGLLAPEILGAGAAGGLGGLFGAGEAAAGGTGLATSALGGAELGGAAAGVDISDLLASGAAGGAVGLGDTAIPENATFTSGGPISGVNVPAATPGGTDLTTSLISGGGAGPTGGDLAATAGGDSGGSSLFSNLVSGAGNQIAKNPIGFAAGGAGLVGSLLQGNKSSGPAQDALKAEAPVLQQQGNTLQSYLSSGTLPPALQAQLDQQVQAAKARIVSNHAAQGRSTDPAQNSALAQELNNVDLQATALKADTETKLYQQGMRDIQLSAELNTTLANFDRQDQQAVTQALMNFAKAMTPGAGGVQLKLG